MMKNKIEVLLKIANLFNENAITWNVGASCMLYLRDVVEDFNDIDLMIHIDDVEKDNPNIVQKFIMFGFVEQKVKKVLNIVVQR